MDSVAPGASTAGAVDFRSTAVEALGPLCRLYLNVCRTHPHGCSAFQMANSEGGPRDAYTPLFSTTLPWQGNISSKLPTKYPE